MDPESVEPRQLKIYKALLLSVCYTASIGGTGTLVGTAPNLVLTDYISKQYDPSPISFFSWLLYAVPGMLAMLMFSWFWLQFAFIGFGRRKVGEEDGGDPELDSGDVVRQVLAEKYRGLGSIKYEEMSVLVVFLLQVGLWLTRQPGFARGWGDFFEKGLSPGGCGVVFKIQVFRNPNFKNNLTHPRYVSDATVVTFTSILLFFLPNRNPFLSNHSFKPSTSNSAILTWNQLERRLSWGTVLLLGGSMAMAKGVEASGLSELVGTELSAVQRLPETLFVIAAAVLATALTEFSSNVATASIFIPVLGSIVSRGGAGWGGRSSIIIAAVLVV